MPRPISKLREAGFSLLELLAVTVIIGGLAAIAIPVFLNQRNKAWVGEMRAALRDANTAAQSLEYADYSDITHAALAAEGYNSSANIVIAVSGAGPAYCIRALHMQLPPEHEWKLAVIGSAYDAPSPADDC